MSKIEEAEYHGKTLKYWKKNAKEDYIKVPISVLKYITVLEQMTSQPLNLDVKVDDDWVKVEEPENYIIWSLSPEMKLFSNHLECVAYQQAKTVREKIAELEEDNEQLENDLRNMANLVGSQSNQIEQLTQERDVEHGLVKMRSEENTSLTTELIKLTKQLSAEKQKNKNLIENGYYDDQPIKGSVDYLLMAEELKAEKQKNEELKKGVEEISNQNKYKQVGDRDSYSSYNEGWQDCIDSVEQLLNK
jgi:hypothetical protein